MRIKDCEKERRVKEAVVKLFLREGIEGTSISKIAREAGVSPATVYIYYENKEQMMTNIYREYASGTYAYLMQRVREDMDGPQLVRALVRGYYDYITENREIYSFVEQCSHCPSMNEELRDVCRIFDLMEEMKARGYLRRYSSENLAALMFYPVKAITVEFPVGDQRAEALLEELIEIIQRAILL